MKILLQGRNNNYCAIGDYELTDGSVIVFKNSIVSKKISVSKTFRGVDSVKRLRNLYVKSNKTTQDIRFKSSSTAANFITGNSTNGLRVWKTEEGITLKEYLLGLNK